MSQNRLAKEKSPYLLEHADNPVDWYPWSDEALQKAIAENKPILLSIGYAACHWCHVMAHESFEDEETAKLMNAQFINIKVDREERPDLDKIYQTAHYLLTGQSGGWPLTVFLTPQDLSPFFSGTYFPRDARYQLPSFKEVLRLIADVYEKQPDKIKQQNRVLATLLTKLNADKTADELNAKPLQSAREILQKQFDESYGGFAAAPKFPQATKIEFLLADQAEMAEITLKHMAEGGIFDQLGGGFFRYAVDRAWRIPHFEKMLYDNGQLLFLYASACKIFSEKSFAETARKTADWLLAEMQAPNGGFFASLNADSEGVEGKYYLWDKKEIAALLTQDEYKIIALYYGLDQSPTLENHWHLAITKPLSQVTHDLNISLADTEKLLVLAQKKLYQARSKRIRPSRDEKILCSWNCLAIKGLLACGNMLQEQRFITAAKSALNFIHKNMWKEGRLFACYKDNHAYQSAFLDDYAFLLDALLHSLQTEWNNDYFNWANDIADKLITQFYDKKGGGFFFTAHDEKKILYRPKSLMDEALPSGNGVAIKALLTLAHLKSENNYVEIIEKSLKASQPLLEAYPAEHCTLLLALKTFLEPPPYLVIIGDLSEINSWQALWRNKHPLDPAFAITNVALPKSLAHYKPQGTICAYLCEGTQCSSVIQDLAELERAISF